MDLHLSVGIYHTLSLIAILVGNKYFSFQSIFMNTLLVVMVMLSLLLTLLTYLRAGKGSSNIDKLVDEKLERINSATLTSQREINRQVLDLNHLIGKELGGFRDQMGGMEKTSIESLTNIQKQIQDRLNELNQTNQKGLQVLSETNIKRLNEIQSKVEQKMDEQLKRNIESFDNVRKNLVKMQGSAEQMIKSTGSIDKLNSIFERTSVKSFGDFGEKYLEKFLSDNLYKSSWNKQVNIPGTSSIIDYVISIGDHKLGIDSKFPLTRYRDYLDADRESKDASRKVMLASVKQMAESLASKYYHGDYLARVMMYVPSDGLYVELVSDDKLMARLSEIKVNLVSPSTLFPVILMIGDMQLKQQINANAEHIIKGLQVVGKNVDAFQNEFRKLGDKLRLAQQNYDSAGRSLDNVSTEVKLLGSSEEYGNSLL